MSKYPANIIHKFYFDNCNPSAKQLVLDLTTSLLSNMSDKRLFHLDETIYHIKVYPLIQN